MGLVERWHNDFVAPTLGIPTDQRTGRSPSQVYLPSASQKITVYRQPDRGHPALAPHAGVIMDFGVSFDIADVVAAPDQTLAKFICHAPDCVMDELTATNTGANIQVDPDLGPRWAIYLDQIEPGGGVTTINQVTQSNPYKSSDNDVLSFDLLEQRQVSDFLARFVNPGQPLFVRVRLRGSTASIAALVQDVQLQVTVRLRLLYAR